MLALVGPLPGLYCFLTGGQPCADADLSKLNARSVRDSSPRSINKTRLLGDDCEECGGGFGVGRMIVEEGG